MTRSRAPPPLDAHRYTAPSRVSAPKVEPPYSLFIDFNLLISLHLSDTPARCAFSLNMNFSLHIWYLLLFLFLFVAHLFDFSSNIFGLELYDVLLTHSRPLLPCASPIFIYKLVYTK